jgi:hypothetical protein
MSGGSVSAEFVDRLAPTTTDRKIGCVVTAQMASDFLRLKNEPT